MDQQTQVPNSKFIERLAFYEDTIACKKTSRPLVAPMIGYIPINLYKDTTAQAVMEDWENGFPSFIRFHEEFQPDLAWGPDVLFPTKPLDIMDCNFVKWPGKHFDDPNRGFQVLDHEFMKQDEYLEYAEDPTGFMMRKIIPRHYSKLEGLQMLDFTNFVYMGGAFATIPAAFPPVKEAFKALSESGAAMLDQAQKIGKYIGMMAAMGWPQGIDYCAIAPFDVFNDTFRGLVNTTMDMIECPDELLTAIKACTKIQVRSIKAQFKMNPHLKTVIFFIHNGMDNFMSLEQYQTFYWPGLKACMEAVIEMGGVPRLYLEDNYEKKLDLFAKELPAGKCILSFINTDMIKVKKKLGEKICFTAGVDSSLLQYGTKEQVVENVKDILDICAPGGGFILEADTLLDVGKAENLHAMYETAKNYVNV